MSVESSELAAVLVNGHFFEGPRWREGRLWVSDFFGHKVLSVDPHATADVRVEAEVPAVPSGLGWLPDGRLLIVSMMDQRVLRREPDGRLEVHAELSSWTGGHLVNDMYVDAAGHAYVSSFAFNPYAGDALRPSALLHVHPDGAVDATGPELYVPNGIVALSDGTLVVAETMGNRLSAFDVSGDGTPRDRRDWAVFGPLPESDDVPTAAAGLSVSPDGIAVDSDGAVWVADAFGSRVIRVHEGGEVSQEVHVGETGAYACALGGPDGRTLFVCTAPDFDAEARSAKAEARVLATRVPVPG